MRINSIKHHSTLKISLKMILKYMNPLISLNKWDSISLIQEMPPDIRSTEFFLRNTVISEYI